ETAPFGLGHFPSDEDLRAKAREILGTQNTAADNPVLSEKFKDMMKEKLGLGLGAPTTVSTSTTTQSQGLTAGSSAGG
ncbi:hypothetical protein NPN16_24770, partial [Vibrio parahaemolyticus]|nr:hypothetical protein [Vibrio parahaemolyticus]